MEITDKLIETLYKRVEQVFIAKKNHKPNNIELTEKGFACSYSYSISYGGTEVESCFITSKDLKDSLDDLIAKREEEEEKQRIQLKNMAKARQIKKNRIDREERRKEYEKLKKEFESDDN